MARTYEGPRGGGGQRYIQKGQRGPFYRITPAIRLAVEGTASAIKQAIELGYGYRIIPARVAEALIRKAGLSHA